MPICSTALEFRVAQARMAPRAFGANQLEDNGGALSRCPRLAGRLDGMPSPKKRLREMRATPERVKVWGMIVRTLELWPSSHTQHAWPGPMVRPANASRRANAMTPAERADVLALVNGPAVGKASSNQIVPQLVDAAIYVASGSTTYRLQRAAHHFTHRGPVQPPVRRDIPSYLATGPVQACTRDMMYLKSPVRGLLLLQNLTIDIWSLRIMDWPSFPMQRDVHRGSFFTRVCDDDPVPAIGWCCVRMPAVG